MSKFWTIVGHTFTKHAMTKSYIITTLITILLVLAVMNIDSFISLFDDEADSEEVTIAVATDSDRLFGDVQNALKDVENSIILEHVNTSDDTLQAAIKDGTYAGALRLYYEGDEPAATYYQEQNTSNETTTSIKDAVQQVKEAGALEQVGLTAEDLMAIEQPVMFDVIALNESSQTDQERTQATSLVYILLFIIYFTVIMYGNMIAMEVATEKSSRVMEILISSVSPVTQMFAKIVGVALLGLFQFALIGLVSGGSMLFRNDSGESQGMLADLGLAHPPVDTLLYLLLFFLLGYLFYATLAAMLGCLVARLEEVSQAVGPINYLLIIAFIIAVFGLQNPESSLVVWGSFIPPLAPILMFLRTGLVEVPLWEISLSVGLLVASIIVLALFGAKVYRGGVMMYGSRNGALKDIRRALRMGKQ
ncbi:ABC transporter permease [Aureibacillus halotolerans]|uniref:ABC-2 type transport system permease protein n=1 Tax=Aureibacillus halotolerans TaxID=1508390 RepID=A0A4R6TUK5_9BACI|nr:ABC transporter permease [Aureibacillus halotolerans]TDQ37420.1 ABC-2 type transport system permease protein [Aureibacillus halotolerans]